VVLLNETAAARFFPGVDPVGQSIGLLGDRTVIGIVHDVRVNGPETNVRPEAYVPFAASWAPGAFLVVRTHGDPGAFIPAIKARVWSVAPDVPLSDFRTLEEFLARLIAQRKFNMLLIGLFGVLALTIASVGIFGVMAFIVEQRRSEIGLRMALGAERNAVVGMVLRRAVAIVSVGLAAGLAVAWPLSRMLGAFLFDVRPHDAAAYAGAAGVLLIAGLIAAFVPARRAAAIDPVVALRGD
jgi:putative ABC transport system permease protein